MEIFGRIGVLSLINSNIHQSYGQTPHRHRRPREAGEVSGALEKYGGKAETKIGLKLLTLFASRPGEIRKARCAEFDIKERVKLADWWATLTENL